MDAASAKGYFGDRSVRCAAPEAVATGAGRPQLIRMHYVQRRRHAIGLLLCTLALGADGCRLFRRPEPRKSQPALVMQRMGRTVVTIRYNRPSARGRPLFGALVPYGVVWCPGADEATTIALSRDVTFAGQPLGRGVYSVWAIPGPTDWTLILSHAAHVFHTPYPAGRDALRVHITPAMGTFYETLAFEFPEADADHATLDLHWGTTIVEIPIGVR